MILEWIRLWLCSNVVWDRFQVKLVSCLKFCLDFFQFGGTKLGNFGNMTHRVSFGLLLQKSSSVHERRRSQSYILYLAVIKSLKTTFNKLWVIKLRAIKWARYCKKKYIKSQIFLFSPFILPFWLLCFVCQESFLLLFSKRFA